MPVDRRARLKQWIESGEAQLQPLTFPQRELWETSPVPVADAANHICCLIEVRGLLTERDCRAAIQRVTDRQEVLRLSFLPGKERPLQMIRKEGEASCVFREVAPAGGGPEAIEEMAAEIFHTPFDLVQGPLYRVVDLRRTPNDHVLVFAVHHTIADGWSLGVFVQELFAAYIYGMMGSPRLCRRCRKPTRRGAQLSALSGNRQCWRERIDSWKTKLAGSPGSGARRSRAVRQKRWVSQIPAGRGERDAGNGAA